MTAAAALDDKSTPPDWKERIEAIVNTQGTNNTVCADCNVTSDAEWSVWNHGVFVCIKCSGIHRQLGVHISKVKSTQLDKWRNNELAFVSNLGGNLRVNQTLEHRKPKYFLNPSECPSVDGVRKFFIRQKYECRRFHTETKEDAATHDMPQKVQISTFLEENSKKKLYFQLLTQNFCFFKNGYDSYPTTSHDVLQIKLNIVSSTSVYTNTAVLVVAANNEDTVLYRLRAMQDLSQIIDWVHAVRRAQQYYAYIDGQPSNHEHENEHKQQQQNDSNNNQPLAEVNTQDLEHATILGIASKKGGEARTWRKRWWILLNGVLYYFKEDFTTNKKANGKGTPQGHVPLQNADVVWDSDQTRTSKSNAFLICSHNRTFYIQPLPTNKDTFYNAVNSCCESMWNRTPFDFAKYG
mmetsp:Transcript_1652/g.3244  ORF Transcript_1652/g.3244 Transcript_1652/m.3244 type:complete len:408 (-) Transcript_1652:168-1391(-)